MGGPQQVEVLRLLLCAVLKGNWLRLSLPHWEGRAESSATRCGRQKLKPSSSLAWGVLVFAFLAGGQWDESRVIKTETNTQRNHLGDPDSRNGGKGQSPTKDKGQWATWLVLMRLLCCNFIKFYFYERKQIVKKISKLLYNACHAPHTGRAESGAGSVAGQRYF